MSSKVTEGLIMRGGEPPDLWPRGVIEFQMLSKRSA